MGCGSSKADQVVPKKKIIVKHEGQSDEFSQAPPSLTALKEALAQTYNWLPVDLKLQLNDKARTEIDTNVNYIKALKNKTQKGVLSIEAIIQLVPQDQAQDYVNQEQFAKIRDAVRKETEKGTARPANQFTQRQGSVTESSEPYGSNRIAQNMKDANYLNQFMNQNERQKFSEFAGDMNGGLANIWEEYNKAYGTGDMDNVEYGSGDMKNAAKYTYSDANANTVPFGAHNLNTSDDALLYPYLSRIWHGFARLYRPGKPKGFKLTDSMFDLQSRPALLSSDIVIITGGEKYPRRTLNLNPITGDIFKLSDMVIGRYAHATATIDDTILVCGGLQDEKMLQSTELFYDNTWVKAGPMKRHRAYHSAVEVNRIIYVFGGTEEDTVEVFVNESWALIPFQMPTRLARVGLVWTSGSTVLIAGGAEGKAEDGAWLYDTSTSDFQAIAPLPKPDIFNSAGLYTEGSAYLIG